MTLYTTSGSAGSLIAGPVSPGGVLGFFWAYRRIAPELRSRNIVEGVMRAGLLAASTVAVLTTIGIVLSVLFETLHFFSMVSPFDFFFGTVWDPRFSSAGNEAAGGQFGLLPLLWGTLVHLDRRAAGRRAGRPVRGDLHVGICQPEVRATSKPVLEILAGIPTIVYGLFALVTFGPFLREMGAASASIFPPIAC